MTTGLAHAPMGVENAKPGALNDWPSLGAIVRTLKGDHPLPAAVTLPEQSANDGNLTWPGQDAGFLAGRSTRGCWIPNERLLSTIARNTSLTNAFASADDVLRQAIQGISDLILVPGLINLDFADVKTIMSGMGLAIMGTGVAEGEGRAMRAANLAISSPAPRGRIGCRSARSHHQRHWR